MGEFILDQIDMLSKELESIYLKSMSDNERREFLREKMNDLIELNDNKQNKNEA